MGEELREDDPNFRTKRMAQASVASAQVGAQLKADQNRIKGTGVTVSYYAEFAPRSTPTRQGARRKRVSLKSNGRHYRYQPQPPRSRSPSPK